MKRHLAYIRVSTDRQETANQEPEILSALNGQEARWYRETASASRGNRPVLDQLLAEVDTGVHRGAVLYVWALDRLTRKGPLDALLMLDRLERAGVRVKSVRETWLDPQSPVYGLLLPVMAWIAQQEAARLRERVRAGLERAKSAGKKLGRPRAQVDAGRVRQLRDKGLSIREIAKAMNVPPSRVFKSLASESHEKAISATESKGQGSV